MNAHLEMDSIEVLRVKLEVLRQEHRDLDEAIHLMEISGRSDQLTLRRLKKQKLGLKDQIARLEDILTPDIARGGAMAIVRAPFRGSETAWA